MSLSVWLIYMQKQLELNFGEKLCCEFFIELAEMFSLKFTGIELWIHPGLEPKL